MGNVVTTIDEFLAAIRVNWRTSATHSVRPSLVTYGPGKLKALEPRQFLLDPGLQAGTPARRPYPLLHDKLPRLAIRL
jgi:hypothetical protein